MNLERRKKRKIKSGPEEKKSEPGPIMSPALKQMVKRREIYASFGYVIEKERQAIIEAAGPLSGRILEAGTGKGHFALALARLGYSLISFDLSEEQLKIARENLESNGLSGRVELRQENGESLSFPDGSFEVVFSVNMVHHLDNPWSVFSELTRVLKPGGKLVVSDFSREGMSMMAEVHRKEGGQHRVAPVSLAEVEEFLKKEGFSVSKYRTRFQITLVASKK